MQRPDLTKAMRREVPRVEFEAWVDRGKRVPNRGQICQAGVIVKSPYQIAGIEVAAIAASVPWANVSDQVHSRTVRSDLYRRRGTRRIR
jgi:hypothetical protein